MKEARRVAVAVRRLTPDRWPDLVRLFGENGVVGGCWCRYWRTRTRREYLERKGEPNKRAMRSLVKSGRVPGLLAYAGTTPVGWCAVAPREAYPALERSRSRRPVDDRPVWSITCLYVARSHRRRGLSRLRIEAAVAHVRREGGRVVESYPVPAKAGVRSTNYAFTGYEKAFTASGFTEVWRRVSTRPIMRYEIRPQSGSSRRKTRLRRS